MEVPMEAAEAATLGKERTFGLEENQTCWNRSTARVPPSSMPPLLFLRQGFFFRFGFLGQISNSFRLCFAELEARNLARSSFSLRS